jgi:hypothetical protein
MCSPTQKFYRVEGAWLSGYKLAKQIRIEQSHLFDKEYKCL